MRLKQNIYTFLKIFTAWILLLIFQNYENLFLDIIYGIIFCYGFYELIDDLMDIIYATRRSGS